jgi:hypothetical protein
MLIEALVETAYLAAPERAGEPLEITQAMIQEPLRFLHDRPTAAKIALRAAPNGFHAQFTSDLVNRRGVLLKPGQVNLSANLSWSRERVAPTTNRHDAHEWFDIEYLDRDAPMYHGPPLRGLTRLRGGGGFAQGTVDVRPLVELSGKRPGGCWAAHPALLDACFFACGVVLWLRNESEFGIPRGVRRLWFSPRIPSPQGPCVVHLAIKGIEDSVGQFDFTLADAEGNLLLAADGYEAFLFATAKV